MPTPKLTLSDVDNRTPERPGSISRKLLTPCRQIGLSRKRKTPRTTPTLPQTNTENDIKCEDTPVKLANTAAVRKSKVPKDSSEKSKSNTGVENTNTRQKKQLLEPVTSEFNIDQAKCIENPDVQRKGRKSRRSNQSKTSSEYDYLQPNEESKISRPNKSRKQPISEEQASKSPGADNTKVKSDCRPNKSTKQPISEEKISKSSVEDHIKEKSDSTPSKLNKQPISEETISKLSVEDNTKTNLDASSKSSKSVSRRLSMNTKKIIDDPDIINNASIAVDPTSLSEPATASIKEGKNPSIVLDEISPPKKSKRFRKILSMKKTYSDDCIDGEDSPSKESLVTKVGTVTVELDRFAIDNIITQHSTTSCNPSPADRLDDFTCSPAEDKWNPSDFTTNIIQLEDTIKTKQGHLSHLKQVQVYQKMHDIEDLKNLFATWKKGCIQALNDLLPHLASHSQIDMATLLKNLQIPSKFIQLSPQETLV